MAENSIGSTFFYDLFFKSTKFGHFNVSSVSFFDLLFFKDCLYFDAVYSLDLGKMIESLQVI